MDNKIIWDKSSTVTYTDFIAPDTLEVKFGDGKIYHYLQFPYEKYEILKQSTSIGSFIFKAVRNFHQYIHINQPKNEQDPAHHSL